MSTLGGPMAVATIAAKNYLSFARVVADSFRRHHPDIPFYALLTDEVDGYFEPSAEPFHLVQLADIAIPDLRPPRTRAYKALWRSVQWPLYVHEFFRLGLARPGN